MMTPIFPKDSAPVYKEPFDRNMLMKVRYVDKINGKDKIYIFYKTVSWFGTSLISFDDLKRQVEKRLYEEYNAPANTEFRYYWLDKDGDEISIANENDFILFYHQQSGDLNLWVTAKNFPEKSKTKNNNDIINKASSNKNSNGNNAIGNGNGNGNVKEAEESGGNAKKLAAYIDLKMAKSKNLDLLATAKNSAEKSKTQNNNDIHKSSSNKNGSGTNNVKVNGKPNGNANDNGNVKEGEKSSGAKKSAANMDLKMAQSKNVIHEKVECDSCLMYPIIGFRYKCLQCDDFDICENCEQKHAHSEHIMIRIPNDNCRSVIKSLMKYGCIADRKHNEYNKIYYDFETAASAQAKAGAPDTSGKINIEDIGKARSRRRRHRRNIFSHVYGMMQDFAEGGVDPPSPFHLSSPERANTDTGNKDAKKAADEPIAANAKKNDSNDSKREENIEEKGTETVHEVVNQVQKQVQETVKMAAAAAASVAMNSLSKTFSEINNSEAKGPTTSTADNKANNDGNNKVDETVKKSDIGNKDLNILPLETLLDPKFIKAGIQILNNFSEMFAKILDPVGQEAGNEAAHSSHNDFVSSNISNTQASSSRASSMDGSITIAKDTANVNSNVNKNDKDVGNGSVEKFNECSVEDVTDSDTDSLSESFIKLDAPEKEKEVATDKNVNENNTTEDSVTAQPTNYVTDFAKLRATLKAYADSDNSIFNNDNNSNVNGQTSLENNEEGAATDGAENEEKRAVIVYHPNQLINAAVHQMVVMGFSNEDNCLTQLVESVNGDVSRALDLIISSQN